MSTQITTKNKRKIIHIDMDCFYAAIEIRDNPALVDKPVAVGGISERSVLCTCNYIARRYGIHSAMPTQVALRQCKNLIILPVNMAKYREVAKQIHKIFYDYTDSVEPLALDEAYLEVTGTSLHQGSATLIAQAIRKKIWDSQQLIASAGVAPNKFLAKVASGWKKPNGLFVIRPEDIAAFVKDLPVNKLYGVGKVNLQKLWARNIKTCIDLQKVTLTELMQDFGKLGQNLYEQCRGQDNRQVEPHRVRKSLSVERTLSEDALTFEECLPFLKELYQNLLQRIEENAKGLLIKNQYLKLKFSDFKENSVARITTKLDFELYLKLFQAELKEHEKPIRLIGLGVYFFPEKRAGLIQRSLWSDSSLNLF